MNITHIEPVIVHVNHRGDWIFVRVHTDAGLVGLGEASHSINDRLLVATLDYLAEQLVGKDASNIEARVQQMRRFATLGGRIGATALSAIEQALWDVLGQRLGVPIHVLLGGALRNRLRLYANINRHVRDRSPEGFARAASRAVDQGFTAIKVAPFDEVRAADGVRTGLNATWQPGVERVRAVREAIGDAVELAVDCHSRFDAGEALLVAEELRALDLFWFEEPVHHRFVDDLARITHSVPMMTASAESLFGMENFAPFLRERVVDVLMPDVKHDGGLLETKKIAAAGQINKLLIAPHQPAGPVATAASGHVCSTLDNFYKLEHAWGEVSWRANLLDPPERIEDGQLVLPEGAGLGHRLDEDVLAAHRVNVPRSENSSKVEPQIRQ